MRATTRFLSLTMLVLAPLSAWSAPLRVISPPSASPLEKYAVQELRSYLGRLTEEKVLSGPGEGTLLLLGTLDSPALRSFSPALPAKLGEQEILVKSGSVGRAPAVAVTGGSPDAVLWAAYALLEKLGLVFEFSGDVVPQKRVQLNLKGLDLRQSPSIKERGLRLHLNFPMDQSSYSLPEFLAWVDRVARLKCNYLMFHFYSNHPWFFFRYKNAQSTGATFFVGTHMFGGKYMLPPDMIGREFIRNKAQYFPPELEGMEPSEALHHATEARIRAVIDHAHTRGIKCAVSFEPLGTPGDITAHLGEWEQAAGGHDKLMREVTVARLNACMDAYPNADEYQLISVEGSDDAPPGMDLKADLKRLCDKYKIPFDPSDERQFAGAREAGVNLAPYNAPSVSSELDKGLMRPVVSTLRYVDMALDVLADPRVADRLKREKKLGNVGIYLPNGSAVKMCTPALRAMMPANSRLQMMVDYGARGTADQMPTWEAFHGANLQLGVISWLEFDGSMFLPEAWPHAVYDCVRNAKDLPLMTLVCNHWRVSGLEADAAGLAETPWNTGQSYDQWMDGYLTRLYGAANVPTARRAYDALEQATLYCREHLFNVGFCYEGRFTGNFGYAEEYTNGAKVRFTAARDGFSALATALPAGRPKVRAEYLGDRCQCALYHLDTMRELAGAEVGPSDSPARIKQASEHANRAFELAQSYMRTYAKKVLDRGDEGMLVNYHFGVVRQAKQMAQGANQLAIIAGADPQKPIMAWSFEQGDASTVPDASGNGFAAEASGKIAFAPGKFGRALKLDGHSCLLVPGAASFNPDAYTLSAWICPDKTNARRGILVKRMGNIGAPFVFGLDESRLSFEGLGTGGSFWPFNFRAATVAANRWSHVAVTFAATKQIVMYLDGKPVATLPITEHPTSNADPLVIGREAWGGEEGHETPAFFQGLLDEVKVWKRALTGDEVAAEAAR